MVCFRWYSSSKGSCILRFQPSIFKVVSQGVHSFQTYISNLFHVGIALHIMISYYDRKETRTCKNVCNTYVNIKISHVVCIYIEVYLNRYIYIYICLCSHPNVLHTCTVSSDLFFMVVRPHPMVSMCTKELHQQQHVFKSNTKKTSKNL